MLERIFQTPIAEPLMALAVRTRRGAGRRHVPALWREVQKRKERSILSCLNGVEILIYSYILLGASLLRQQLPQIGRDPLPLELGQAMQYLTWKLSSVLVGAPLPLILRVPHDQLA